MNRHFSARRLARLGVAAALAPTLTWLDAATPDASLRLPREQPQLPHAAHAKMIERPVITVGRSDAAIVGADNRALQAAVDYIAGLGGGVVEIGAGDYMMYDSLHLRSFVTVRGVPGKTVLRKARAASSPLSVDGDFGEEQITLANPQGFEVGHGIAIWSDNANYFHATVARITGRNGDTFAIDRRLISDFTVAKRAQAATIFPVVSGYEAQQVRIEGLTIEGNKAENLMLDGCRGGGIYLYRCPGAVIRDCTVQWYHGDGISFQQCHDVTVERCVSEENSGVGIHPGSGSQRANLRDCTARRNGFDGLYICWRVRDGVFERNILEGNGRNGISIGHKDTDNVIRENEVRANAQDGILFREETHGLAAHRNLVEKNLIEDNGIHRDVAGIRVRGETTDLVFRDNIIRDRRPLAGRRQTAGIRIDEPVGAVTLVGNRIDAATAVDDRRSMQGRP